MSVRAHLSCARSGDKERLDAVARIRNRIATRSSDSQMCDDVTIKMSH